MRRAMTLEPGRMSIESAPAPVRAPDHALVDVLTVGLCGSDYHLFDGTHPYAAFPQTQGHEFSGIVRELPPGTDRLAIGDLVAVEPLMPCGVCIACRRGRTNCCVELRVIGVQVEGALTETVAVPVDRLHPVPGLDPELAALVEPTSIGLHAVGRAAPRPGETVLVLGGGPIGLASALAAAELGCRVILADRIPSRLEHARRAGADLVLDTRDLRAGVLAATRDEGPEVVIDATGAPAMIRTAIEVVASSGTVVVVGVSTEDVTVPVALLSRKELSIHGSRNSAGEYAAAIELVGSHPETVRSWITHRVGLDEVPEGIAFAMRHPELVVKMLVRIGGHPLTAPWVSPLTK